MDGTVSLERIDYSRRREAQERAAAKRATTSSARRIHQELALLHAQASGAFPESRD
jgi:hypothetical protein